VGTKSKSNLKKESGTRLPDGKQEPYRAGREGRALVDFGSEGIIPVGNGAAFLRLLAKTLN